VFATALTGGAEVLKSQHPEVLKCIIWARVIKYGPEGIPGT